MNTLKRTLLFTDSLLTMSENSLTLFNAVTLLSGTVTDKRLQESCAALKAALENGAAFSVSLQDIQRKTKTFGFSGYHFALFASIEKTGNLGVALKTIQIDLERKEDLRGQLTAVLVYPCFIVLAALSGALFLLQAGLPFLRQTGTMPAEFYTDALHGFITAHLFLCAAAAFFAYILIKIFKEDSAETQCFYLLSALLAAHIPIVEAVTETVQAARNPRMKKALVIIKKELAAGASVLSAFKKAQRFPPFVFLWLEIAQKQGDGAPIFSFLAEYYRKKDVKKRTVTMKFIEPAAIAIVGAYVLLLIQSIVIPLLTYYGNVF